MTSIKRFSTPELPHPLSTPARATRSASTLLAAGMLAFIITAPAGAVSAAGTEPWITTWAATPAPRWAEELPAPFNVPEVLEGQTVRQVARISVGGDQLRIVLSNEFGNSAGDDREHYRRLVGWRRQSRPGDHQAGHL